MTYLAIRIIHKVRDLCREIDELHAIASKPAKVHLAECENSYMDEFKIDSIVFGDHGELTVTNKRIYLTGYGGRIGKTVLTYDCWHDLLNMERSEICEQINRKSN